MDFFKKRREERQKEKEEDKHTFLGGLFYCIGLILRIIWFGISFLIKIILDILFMFLSHVLIIIVVITVSIAVIAFLIFKLFDLINLCAPKLWLYQKLFSFKDLQTYPFYKKWASSLLALIISLSEEEIAKEIAKIKPKEGENNNKNENNDIVIDNQNNNNNIINEAVNKVTKEVATTFFEKIKNNLFSFLTGKKDNE